MRLRGPSPAAHPLPELVALSSPRSAASESYRKLRTNVQFADVDGSSWSLLITSATPEEGKTTTLANFGVVIAQGGARVCLVDSDLRRPTLHRLFGVDNDKGLTTALMDGVPLSAVAQATRIPNLSVVPSGPIPPNPADLVGSPRMRELMESARPDFDRVLLDSPPVLSVADAATLATCVDGVILVVRMGKIPHGAARRATAQIRAVRGRLLGVVLNRADFRREGYSAGYADSYYYAYDSNKRES